MSLAHCFLLGVSEYRCGFSTNICHPQKRRAYDLGRAAAHRMAFWRYL